MAKNWIAGATKNKGALHRNLGIAERKKIPQKRLRKAAAQGGKIGKEATLAETLEHLPHGHPTKMGPRKRK